MYYLKKIGIMYHGNNVIDILGKRKTLDECKELVRDHLMMCNDLIANSNDAPECIKVNARANIERNPDLEIEVVGETGVVFIDGAGPEVDYYTITWSNS